jgi:hypothetical protein
MAVLLQRCISSVAALLQLCCSAVAALSQRFISSVAALLQLCCSCCKRRRRCGSDGSAVPVHFLQLCFNSCCSSVAALHRLPNAAWLLALGSCLQEMAVLRQQFAPKRIAKVAVMLACTRQHTSAYGSIRQHTAAYGSIRQRTPAYVISSSRHKKGSESLL